MRNGDNRIFSVFPDFFCKTFHKGTKSAIIMVGVYLKSARFVVKFSKALGNKKSCYLEGFVMTGVLIADDHDIVREGLAFIISSKYPYIKVIGQARDGLEAVKMCEKLRPALVIMDIGMPKLNGIDAAKQILKKNNDIKVIILSMFDDDTSVMRALEAGVSGYVLKSESCMEIIDAVHAVTKGKSYLSPVISSQVVKHFQIRNARDKSQLDILTKKEIHVLQLIAEGYSSKEIANLLNVSFHTVKTHRNHLMEKLELHSVADLTRYALAHNLIAAKRRKTS